MKRFAQVMRLARGNKVIPKRTMRRILRKSKRGTCRSFVKSLLAENLLRNKADLQPFERWAFEIRNAPKWKRSPYLYQRAILIASHVLVRQKLYPEAASLLHSMENLEDRGLRPYIQIARAALALKRNRLDEGLKAIRTLTRGSGKPPRWQFSAFIAHASLAFKTQRLTETLETVMRADEQLQKNRDRGGQLWLLGAESALRLGELKTARALYRRTFQEGTAWHGATALMRIGDLLARTKGDSALSKIKTDFWNRARRKSRGPALGQLLQLRNLIISTPRFGRDRVREISGLYKNALSKSVSLQAGYALARIQQHRGNFKLANKTIGGLIKEFPFLGEDITVRSRQGEILNAWFKQMARQGDWLDLVNAFRESSREETQLLDSQSTNHVAHGFNQTGKIGRSVDLMLRILGTDIEERLREQITIRLWDAYANIGDQFRRELVERYFISRYPKSRKVWRFYVRSAIAHMKRGKLNSAMRELRRAAKLVPAGDGAQRVRLIQAEVESLKGNANKASKTLRKQLPATGQDPIELQRIVVNILSECARSCSKKNVEMLVKTITEYQEKIQINERIRYLLRARSVEIKNSKKEDGNPGTKGPAPPGAPKKGAPRSDEEKDDALRKSLTTPPADARESGDASTGSGDTQAVADEGANPTDQAGTASTEAKKEEGNIWDELNKIAPDLNKKSSSKRRRNKRGSRKPNKTSSGGR